MGSAETPFVTMDEDSTSAPIAVLANDTDVDPDTLTVTSAISPNGVVAVNAGTTLSFTPASDFNGATTISYTISDGEGGNAAATRICLRDSGERLAGCNRRGSPRSMRMALSNHSDR